MRSRQEGRPSCRRARQGQGHRQRRVRPRRLRLPRPCCRAWLKAPARAAWNSNGRRKQYNGYITRTAERTMQSEYIEKVVSLNRVSKTVKGGRVMKFSALMRRRRRQGHASATAWARPPKFPKPSARASRTPRRTWSPLRSRRHHHSPRGHRRVRRRPRAAEARCPRYRRYRRRRRPCRRRGCRHQRHPYKVPALQQPRRMLLQRRCRA